MIVQVLPWGLGLMHGPELHLSRARVLAFVVVVAAYLVAGGVVAYVIGDATAARHAIAYDLGWQGLIGGLLKTEFRAPTESDSRP